jgi:hypothetical protein
LPLSLAMSESGFPRNSNFVIDGSDLAFRAKPDAAGHYALTSTAGRDRVRTLRCYFSKKGVSNITNLTG